MPQSVRAARVSEVPPGTGQEVVIGDRLLAVYNVDGVFYALDGICPHAGGPLGEGALNGCIVTCPWHGWQFDVTTGKHCLSSQIRQSYYPTRVDGDDVFVELPGDGR
ncbi:MAG: Rieske (2Fe-2S) protein [Planctomycetaceae bacterium]